MRSANASPPFKSAARRKKIATLTARSIKRTSKVSHALVCYSAKHTHTHTH
jgi:hypothetical protein